MTIHVCSRTAFLVRRDGDRRPSWSPRIGPLEWCREKLWPVNHKLQPVTLSGVADPDGDLVTVQIVGVTQDEPLQGLGDGNTAVDANITGANTVSLRAERSGGGNGRVYRIHFQATDDKGAQCDGSVAVCVSHDAQPNTVCVDDGQSYDSTAQ